MTSSKISRVLSREVMARRASRYPRAGGTQPILPTTGSTMTQAIWCLNFLKTCFERVGVVVGKRERELREFFGNAGRAGNAKSGNARSGFDEQRVRMAMVAALEFHDVFALGVSAGEADG